MKKYQYNTLIYNFNTLLCEIINYNSLSKLHQKEDFTKMISDSINDTHKYQQSEYHKLYYDNFENKIKSKYVSFIKNVIKPIYGETIVYQQIPTFRIHFPNGKSVGMFHKDSQLRDKDWHISIKEDNFYLPLVDAYDSNTIWVESQEDLGDYNPINCKYGEFVQWDGTNLMHGNKLNTTLDTRISMDFRIARYKTFISSKYNTKNNKTTFSLGGYYEKI